MSYQVSHHSAMKRATNDIHLIRIFSYGWKLENILLNSPWAKEKWKVENIFIWIIMKNNYQPFWDVIFAVCRRKFINLNEFIREKKVWKSNVISLHIKKLVKEQKLNLKNGGGKKTRNRIKRINMFCYDTYNKTNKFQKRHK